MASKPTTEGYILAEIVAGAIEGNTDLKVNISHTLAVRSDYAAANDLETFSDLAPVDGDLVFGVNYDFFEREDGFKPLTEIYGLHFKDAIDMDQGLVYEALFKGEIDDLSVFTTDGQAPDDQVKTLKDDKQFYPSYQAGLVVRQDRLEEYPSWVNF